MTFYRLMVGVALGCAAGPGIAQNVPTASVGEPLVGKTLDGSLARLPDSMFGIACRASYLDGLLGSAACWDPAKGPLVSVYTYALGRDLSQEELVDLMHRNFRDVGSVQVIEEEPFAIASAPGATAMRGIYQTGSAGRKLTWSVAYQGTFTRVMLTVADNAKREDFEDEVMAKVFGPDRYVPVASATQ